MVKLNVDYDSKAKCWFVKTSDLLGVHAEGETLEQLCGKLPAIVSDLVESNQTKMAGTCYWAPRIIGCRFVLCESRS
jgi:hypothetical protein